MSTLFMFNNNNNNPRILRAIRVNSKYQYSRGEFDEDEIKKMKEKFGVESTVMIEMVHKSRKVKRWIQRDRSRSCVG